MRKGLLGTVIALVVMALTPPARGQTQAEIAKSIENGVKYLKSVQQQNGMWDISPQGLPAEAKGKDGQLGTTALVALTLLEVGDVDNDPDLKERIRKAAEVIRSNNHANLTFTYSLATSIWFLDKLIDTHDNPGGKRYRLAEPEADRRLILELAARLAKGQNKDGGWTYNVPMGKETLHEGDDNSNTQFAVLALWTARRHGFNPDAQLRAAEARFLKHQSKQDGGWSYVVGNETNASTAPMTCSGLIGLAVGHAIKVKKRTTKFVAQDKPAVDSGPKVAVNPIVGNNDEIKDPKIKKAMEYLSTYMVDASPLNSAHGMYGLWSLERVGTIYNVRRINEKDWYAYGAPIIIKNQNQGDGSWQGQYAGPVDTSFALLFLHKVNLFGDLSVALRGEDTLSSGASANAGAKPAVVVADAKPTPATPGLKQSTAADIAAEVVKANTTAKQIGLLNILKETKGRDYTDAFVEVIPKLSGTTQQRAREMLAERLVGLSARQLRIYMEKDQPSELRRAAATACGLKDNPDLLIDLETLQKDKDPDVAAAAREAHRKLSGKGAGGR